jgi:asparagine synthase (glutamine-hydrolysing)
VGFSNDKFDEAKYAKEVAQIIHTDHSELYIDSKNVLDVIPKLPDIYSEPFADSSQIPTYLISKFASNNVKVCLSGDGGDELFCGYNRHIQGVKIFEIFSKFPKVIQNKLLYILKLFPFKTWKVAEQILSIKQKNNNLSYHVSKLLNALDKSSDEFSYYLRLISNPYNFDISSNNYYELQKKFQNLDKTLNYREKMMFMDIVQYLPDDILTKVDRASMSNSLEVRAPFLDHKLVEYSLKLPINLKYRENQGKWILKQLVYDYVPKQIMDRPKKGFDVPIESWLRGSLKDWGMSLLSEKKLKENNYFNSEEITKMWNEHQSGSNNWQNNLWSILMFQAWKENF